MFIRNTEKSSIITSLIVILFLSYGQIYNQLENYTAIPIRHRYLLGANLLVLLLVIALVLKKDQVVRAFSQFLAIVSIVLIAVVIYESVRYDYGVNRATAAAKQEEVLDTNQQSAEDLPDFYLIILDGHTRSRRAQITLRLRQCEFRPTVKRVGVCGQL